MSSPPPPKTAPLVLAAARALFRAGDVVEVRVPKAGRLRTISGYFDDLTKMAFEVEKLERARHPGIYWTINPTAVSLLSRSEKNKAHSYADATTGDADILCRRWLPIDVDPKRPSGISSTEDEHTAALDLAQQMRLQLFGEGWPLPISADSGNGAHLLYRIDLPNDPASRELVERCLKALAARYDGEMLSVDTTVHNAARIFKVYGTTSRKGDNTAERPHRISRLLEIPEQVIPVSIELLQALAAQAPSAAKLRNPQSQQPYQNFHGSKPQITLPEFLSKHGLSHRKPAPFGSGTKYVLERCPFDEGHGVDSMVFEMSSGAFGFKCLHAGCVDRDWAQLREKFEGPRRPFVVHSHSRSSSATVPAPEPEPIPAEEPVKAIDVEAAIELAIEAKDILAALRLIPDIAKLRKHEQVVIKVKLKLGFGRDFSGADFDAALRGATSGDETGQKSRSTLPREEGGGGSDGDGDSETDGGLEGPDLRPFPLTDAGNGERIALLFGKDVRYCVEMGKWLLWDGRRWRVDDLNHMRQKAVQMARLLYYQAGMERNNLALKQALEKHARNSESRAGCEAALAMASTVAEIPVRTEDLDQPRFLINCLNGGLDLKSGKLLPHDRELLMTKLVPVKYDPEAKCPRFLDFVNWTMGANPEAEVTERTTRLVGFLQRAFGYALTGDVSERVIFIFYGEGKNGKSTLLNTFRKLLGNDYSSELSIETLMSTKSTDATMRADLASTRGIRFVMTSEAEEEHKIKEGQIKYLTAGMGSTVRACEKYQNPISFEAVGKIFMDCNYRPRIGGTDKAIWDRIRLVPFLMRIAEESKDPHLLAKLLAELPGILAWSVRGCQNWQKEGMTVPKEVMEAGEQWREHDDPLKEFMDDFCVQGKDLFVPVSDMAGAYDWWAKRSLERFPMRRGKFNDHLQARGFVQGRTRDAAGHQIRVWFGVELTSDALTGARQSRSQRVYSDDD